MRFVCVMVLTAAATAAVAQPPRGFGGMMGGGGSVFGMAATNKALNDELKLTDEQKTKLDDAMKPINERRREMMQGFFGGGQPSDDDRKEMQKKQTELNAETKKAVGDILKPEQMKRLTQIHYQQMGVRAFADKEFAAAVKLTDDQQKAAADAAAKFGEQSMEMMREVMQGADPQGDREEFQKKMQEGQKKVAELGKKATEEVTKGFSDEQKKAVKEQLGEPFDLTKLQFRPMRRDG